MTPASLHNLEPEDRRAVSELTLVHPNTGQLAREFIDQHVLMCGSTPDEAALALMQWIALAREACGLDGMGHA